MGYGVAMSKQSYTHLSDADRETLSLGLTHGHSLRAMASMLGRAPSTVSREHTRNVGQGPYRACTTHTLASAQASQPRRPRTLLDPWLWQYVRTHLGQGRSPEQIAGRFRRAYPDDMGKQRSPEPIYAGLSVRPRGTLRSERLAARRQARNTRRLRSRGMDRRGQIPT
jgi:IS30 family transposase